MSFTIRAMYLKRLLVTTILITFWITRLLLEIDCLSSVSSFNETHIVELSISKINGTANCMADNERPVIGILSLPSWDAKLKTEVNRSSYIAASYVKLLESAGARVVPVLVGRDEDYYRSMVNNTNGLLFTGGGLNLNRSIYTQSASYIWKHVININSQGDYYPLLGICLGLELIAYLGNNLTWPLTPCKSWDKPLNLNFTLNTDQLKSTQLFNNSDDSIIDILRNQNVTINYHHQCLTPSTVKGTRLKEMFRIISTNKDVNGIEFVSTMEGIDYPFYGVQFHPERVIFELNRFGSYRKTPHTPDAIKVSQYFANFFVNQARKSCHIYPEEVEWHRKLIYNYCPTFTGLESSHEQIYYFTQ